MAESIRSHPLVNASGFNTRRRPLRAGANLVSEQAQSEREDNLAGPADRCCCCCSRRAGIILLAVGKVLDGLMCMSMEYYWVPFMRPHNHVYATLYNQSCSDRLMAESQNCQQLEDKFLNTSAAIAFVGNNNICYRLLAIMCVGLAAIGFLAACGAKVSCVKIFIFTWPLLFIVNMGINIAMPTPVPPVVLPWVVVAYNICFLLCYFKVLWSFYKFPPSKRRIAQDKAQTHAGVHVDMPHQV